MRRVVLTGATGMIGLALIRRMLQENIEIMAIVKPDSARTGRLPKDERVHLIECSIEDLKALSKKNLGECDAFFHLAWMGTTGSTREDMYLQNRNIEYALDTVQLAYRCGCKVYLGAGSQAEYGRVESCLKGSTPVYPETGYGMAKLCAGQMTRNMCRQFGIRHVWARILSVYGPYDGEGSMIISSIRQMLRGECPRYSPGEQIWDYIYCDDAADALYLLAEKGRNGEIYPVGSGQAYPLKKYIEMMCDAVEKLIRVEQPKGLGKLPYRPNQVMYLCADIGKLTEDTGFVPKVSFDNGIMQTVLWCIDTSGK